nr:TetR family transcriptional regulator [Xanthomonas hortorum]
MVLFDEKGFDSVTVDEIAAAAGISRRSFFRYFSTKEDAVVGTHGAFGPRVAAAFAARSTSEGVWASLRQAFEVIADKVAEDPEAAARTMRVVYSTASLRAYHMEKHNRWAVDLTPEVVKRLGDVGNQRTEAAALVYSALACLDVALSRFARDPHAVPIHQLLDEAFGALAAHCRS